MKYIKHLGGFILAVAFSPVIVAGVYIAYVVYDEDDRDEQERLMREKYMHYEATADLDLRKRTSTDGSIGPLLPPGLYEPE